MFTFGADIFAAWAARPGLILRVLAGGLWMALPAWGGACGIAVVSVAGWAGSGWGAFGGSCRAWLWRGGGEAREGCAAPFAGSGREPGGGASVVFGLPGVPGVQDALVADCLQAGQPQGERGQARQAAPAAGDVAGSGVLDRGEGALGAGAAGVGAAVRRGWVVVFLAGLRRDLWGDGDGLLGAAGWWMLGWCEDLWPATDLPRVFRTADFGLIHAADCCSRYSLWTCCGVRY